MRSSVAVFSSFLTGPKKLFWLQTAARSKSHLVQVHAFWLKDPPVFNSDNWKVLSPTKVDVEFLISVCMEFGPRML